MNALPSGTSCGLKSVDVVGSQYEISYSEPDENGADECYRSCVKNPACKSYLSDYRQEYSSEYGWAYNVQECWLYSQPAAKVFQSSGGAGSGTAVGSDVACAPGVNF